MSVEDASFYEVSASGEVRWGRRFAVKVLRNNFTEPKFMNRVLILLLNICRAVMFSVVPFFFTHLCPLRCVPVLLVRGAIPTPRFMNRVASLLLKINRAVKLSVVLFRLTASVRCARMPAAPICLVHSSGSTFVLRNAETVIRNRVVERHCLRKLMMGMSQEPAL